MDTICANGPADTRFTLFGEVYDLPVFAGPVGAVKLHYGGSCTLGRLYSMGRCMSGRPLVVLGKS